LFASYFPKGIWPLLAFLCLSVLPAFGQGATASITGIITDPSGAVVPNVTVTAENTATKLTQTTRTSPAGLYSLSPLPPGDYRVTATGQGFEGYTVLTTLAVGEAASVNIALKVGSATQSVTVNAGQVLIDTTDAQISNVISQTEITQLPLNGRNPADLILLSPGIQNVLDLGGVGTLPAPSNVFPSETGGSGNGLQQGSTFAMLDGIPNMDTYDGLMQPFPNPDATHSFQAITDNYSVQYGYSPAAVINIDTNSGTNSIHGNAFEFIRNNDLNATNWFSGAVNQLKQNQFGFSVGGPIIKNKLFYFANYQGTRDTTSSATQTAFTPTAAMMNGDFSALPMTLNAPFATVNGKKNQINPDLFSPAAVAMVRDALPLGQVASTGEVTFPGPTIDESFEEGTARLDYTMSPKMRFFLRSFVQDFNSPAGVIPGNILATSGANSGLFFNEEISNTWIPTASLVNTVNASWVFLNVWAGNQQLGADGKPFCLSEVSPGINDPSGCYMEGVGASFSSPGDVPNVNPRTTWWLSDNAIKTVGAHTIQFGGDFAHQYSNNLTTWPAAMSIQFSGQYTGYANADFLLGDASSFYQGASQYTAVVGVQLGLYAQDQYHVNKRLTVTAGLRWDPDFAPAALDGGLVFDPGQQSKIYPSAPAGVLYAGDKGADSALRPSGIAYFEPRLSAAFAITPTTVFRAGFGMFQAPMFWAYYNHTTGIAPTDPEYNLSATASSPISFENPWESFSASGGKSPFPSPQPFTPDPHLPASEAVFLLPMSVGDAFAPDFRLPMTQTWNAGIEKQMSRTLGLNLTYIGSETYHQAAIVDMNPGIYTSGDNRTTYPDFSNIDEVWPEGTASYNAMQIGAVMHNFDNLYVDSHFTWSKATDLTDSGNTAWHGSLGDPFLDPANRNWNRGIAGTNVPLAWVSSVVYTTPRLSAQNFLVRTVGGSWEVSGIGTLQSGYPFSIWGGNGGDSSGSLQWGDRANLVSGQSFGVHHGSQAQWLARYFNTGAFAPNAPGTFGDTGKNILKGPGMDTWDVAMMKNFPFRERYNVQFRWEMYNAFNHPNFGLPDTTVTDPNFGQITGIGVVPPRVMQGALKLSF
jgi:hypothetical protein